MCPYTVMIIRLALRENSPFVFHCIGFLADAIISAGRENPRMMPRWEVVEKYINVNQCFLNETESSKLFERLQDLR